MSFVPLPWCTSQSRISDALAARTRRPRGERATATLLNRQNPIARPARRGARAGDAATPRPAPRRASSASTIPAAPPAPCSAASYESRQTMVSASIAPPPRGARGGDAGPVPVRMNGIDERRARGLGVTDLVSEPVAGAQLALDRDHARDALRVRSGVVAQRGLVAQDQRAHGGVRYSRMGAAERIDVDVAVVGAGAAGLSAALTAADAGRAASRSSARRRSRRPRATGRRAASPRRSRSTTRRSCTSQDTELAGRAPVRRSAAEVLDQRGARR